LVSVPQATTGIWKRSASSAAIRPGMSTITSTSSRSAPRPARRLFSATSMDAAWATLAPPSMASLVASLSWPSRAPTISSRIFGLLPVLRALLEGVRRSRRLDDFGHGDAEAVLDENDFAAGHEAFVDVDLDRLADLPVELDDSADIHAQEMGYRDAGAAEDHRDADGDVEHGLEVGGALFTVSGGRVGAGRGHLLEGHAGIGIAGAHHSFSW